MSLEWMPAHVGYCPGEGSTVSDGKTETRFCPVHGDYVPVAGATACPSCEADPVRSRASLRSIRVVTSEVTGGSDTQGLAPSSDDGLTTIDDVARCPSCGGLVPLDSFQTEAVGEEWEGDAALWAEDGVCRDCYRDVVPGMLRRWSTAEWVGHHFEGWKAQVRKVHEVEVLVESEHDAWLPDEDRHRILDVEKILSARREHLARSQRRLRDLRAEFGLDRDPPEFIAELEAARDALTEKARSELRRRRDEDLLREEERRVGSVADVSPAEAVAAAGLDPETVLGDLARSTGSRRDLQVPDFAKDVESPTRGARWPLWVLCGALVLFLVWWFGVR